MWLEPLDETDDNWYELQAYSEAAVDAGKYIKAGYQLTKSKNCQFYLRWGDGGSVITDIELDGSSEKYKSNTIITFDKAGNYEFYYQGSAVNLTVKP